MSFISEPSREPVTIAAYPAAAAVGTLVCEIVGWLQAGYWPNYCLQWALAPETLSVTWIGAQRIIDFMLNIPLWLEFALIAGAINWAEHKYRESRRDII